MRSTAHTAVVARRSAGPPRHACRRLFTHGPACRSSRHPCACLSPRSYWAVVVLIAGCWTVVAAATNAGSSRCSARPCSNTTCSRASRSAAGCSCVHSASALTRASAHASRCSRRVLFTRSSVPAAGDLSTSGRVLWIRPAYAGTSPRRNPSHARDDFRVHPCPAGELKRCPGPSKPKPRRNTQGRCGRLSVRGARGGVLR